MVDAPADPRPGGRRSGAPGAGLGCLAGLSLALALASAPARAEEPPAPDFPGMQLRARLETRLREQRTALARAPAHYALVFELGQDDLAAALGQVWPWWDGTGFVLGNEFGPEPHGGGLLALLLDNWRPAGRAARLEDRFHFDANGQDLALGAIYRGYKLQMFLPIPGRDPAEIDGRLPTSPRLPRMSFRHWTRPEPVETDAYKFLGLLIAQEADPAATWRNALGQALSLDLLMRNTSDAYLSQRDPALELEDHSRLHLVELLLAFDRRVEGDAADEVKRRFLAVELAREEFRGDEGRESLAHYVESLGLLLDDPRVSWRPDERRRVKAWLAQLERDCEDLAAFRLEELAHLLRGLRLVAANRARLD